MDEWIKKMWYIYIDTDIYNVCIHYIFINIYIHTMEYYTAIKKVEIMLFVGEHMELKTIILSKISQIHKDKYCMFSLIGRIRPKKKDK
jgi:hypothetical protein